MKQIHLNILLPVALLISLAAAAAVFVVPLPFLNTPADTQGPDTLTTNNNNPSPATIDLPKIEPKDWTQLVEALESTRTPPIISLDQVLAEEDEEDEPAPPRNAQLNALQWAYIGNIVEPSRVVACVEMDGKQAWIIEGQTVSASVGIQPIDVTVQAVSEQEITIEHKGATRTFSIQSTPSAPGDFELAT